MEKRKEKKYSPSSLLAPRITFVSDLYLVFSILVEPCTPHKVFFLFSSLSKQKRSLHKVLIQQVTNSSYNPTTQNEPNEQC